MTQQKLSPKMRAMLVIFSSDPALMELTMPFIDLPEGSLSWDKILNLTFNPSQRACVEWAYGMWTDSQKPEFNYFGEALTMSQDMQSAMLRALAMRWG